MNYEKLAIQLELDEGKRAHIYRDTVGKITGGIGRNLSDRAFSEDEIALMLKNDIAIIERDLDSNLPWWRGMCDARQNVLANMAFNVGINRLLGFKNALSAMQNAKYDKAADELLDSDWARQVSNRAMRLAAVMRKGEL